MSVILYSWDSCPFCDKAKRLMEQTGIKYKEIKDKDEIDKIHKMVGQRSVPQMFFVKNPNDKPSLNNWIGGYDDLSRTVNIARYVNNEVNWDFWKFVLNKTIN